MLTAAELWLNAYGRDTALWFDFSTGRRIVTWLSLVAEQDTSLFFPDHEERRRLESVVGQLVHMGIPEAHELETRMATAAH